jgi:acetyl esterase/lipase
MRLLMATVTLLMVICMASASEASPPITFRDLLARNRAMPDVVIPYGAAPQQFGELWLPRGPGPHPTLIMIHGGCWLAELPGTELMAYTSADLRDHGFAVWSIDYRRIGHDGGGYPGTFTDTAQAADLLRQLAPAHNLDLQHVVAIGHSAGGHLAAWLAGRKRIVPSSPLHAADPLPVSAVVSLAGIVDLEAYRAEGPDACGGPPTIDALTGVATRRSQDVHADTSPIRLLPMGISQISVSGQLDVIVPPQFGTAYARAAAASGDRVRDMILEGAGHFELIDPSSPAWVDIRAEIVRLAQ